MRKQRKRISLSLVVYTTQALCVFYVWKRELFQNLPSLCLPMASLLSLSLPKPNIIKASTLSSTTVDTLNDKFSRKGIKFSESNDTPFVELTVRNGSSLRLQIPDAHVTSYKPKVHWKDDGFEEVLYTLPSTAASSSSKAKGGIGLVLNDASEPAANAKAASSLLSASEWTVEHVESDAIDALQVLTKTTSYSVAALDFYFMIQNSGSKYSY